LILAPVKKYQSYKFRDFCLQTAIPGLSSIAQVRFIPRQKGFSMEQHATVTRGSDMWWPEKLGQPVTCGSQYGRRYAFFRELRRLIVESYGKLAVYHTGDLQISGICPNSSRAMSLTFYSQEGLVDIDELRQIS
jgi:hypothetical protein